jgi:hypothetical protein
MNAAGAQGRSGNPEMAGNLPGLTVKPGESKKKEGS